MIFVVVMLLWYVSLNNIFIYGQLSQNDHHFAAISLLVLYGTYYTLYGICHLHPIVLSIMYATYSDTNF
jgi:hypothetical protein